jgi:hypothetical protein
MCPPGPGRADEDDDESSRRRAFGAAATFHATDRVSSGGGDGETAASPRNNPKRREVHVAIVVDVSREALSEDCRGGFDSAGNATRVTRLRACCVAARALASGADAVCAFATDASENGRSKSGVGANRALCLATRASEAARALASFEHKVGLNGATDDDGRSSAKALPKGAPLPTSLSLAAMALRRMAAASPPRAADDADDADASPRRSVVVLLASDGFERGTSVDENSARIDAIDAAMEKLRVLDADATCHVLCVAPARDEETRAAAVAAMTRCATCARDEKERKKKKTARSVSFPAALTDAHRDTCGSSCASCGASLIQTRNIVWSAAGFGKTHAACGAFRRRVFGDDESRATTNLGGFIRDRSRCVFVAAFFSRNDASATVAAAVSTGVSRAAPSTRTRRKCSPRFLRRAIARRRRRSSDASASRARRWRSRSRPAACA